MPLTNIWASGGLGTSGGITNRALTNFNRPSGFYNPDAQSSGRQAAPLERFDVQGTNAINWAIKQPATIAERPIAAVDLFSGGAIGKTLKGIGDAGGSGGQPGPIGQILGGIGEGLNAIDKVGYSIVNSEDANILGSIGKMGLQDGDQLPAFFNRRSDGGFAGFLTGALGLLTGDAIAGSVNQFFNIGQNMTVQDFKNNLAERQWNVNPNTGEVIPWDELTAQAQANPYAFGDRLMSDNLLANTALSFAASPLNLAFFIPGGAFARAGTMATKIPGVSKVIEAGAIIPRTAAAWARPMIPMTANVLKPVRWGYGYMADMGRAAHLPELTASAKAMLSGEVKGGSLGALSQALDMGLRGTKAVFLPGYKGINKEVMIGRGLVDSRIGIRGSEFAMVPTALGRAQLGLRGAGAVGRAYYRGALNIQLGSVAAEYASGAAQNAIDGSFLNGSIVDGLVSNVHNALQKINNHHPLSENESFVLFSVMTMPIIPLLKEKVGAAGAGIKHLAGDNDAVVFAKHFNMTPEEMYTKFGEGDPERGKLVFQHALDFFDMQKVTHDMSLFNRKLMTMDGTAHRGALLKGILRNKVRELRDAGTFRSKDRLDTFLQYMRHGDLEAPRGFEFNITNDGMISSWARMYRLHEMLGPALQNFGGAVFTRSKLLTKEMTQDIVASIHGKEGPVSQADATTILESFPAFLEDPQYGQVFQALAIQGDRQIGGRVMAGHPDERITYERLRAELNLLADKVPTELELFHEAKQVEDAQPKASGIIDPLSGSPLKKVHSLKRIEEMRTENAGNMRTLNREQRTLAHIRNTEFTRNGQPRYNKNSAVVGMDGSVFRLNDQTNGWFVEQSLGWAGNMAGYERMFKVEADNMIRLTTQGSERNPNPLIAHEQGLIKAVEMGGRWFSSPIDMHNDAWFELARRAGFKNIGSYPVFDAFGNMTGLRNMFVYHGGDPATLASRMKTPRVKVESKGTMGPDTIRINTQRTPVFPKIRVSDRKFKNAEEAGKFAIRESEKAALNVPSMESIGPKPLEIDKNAAYHGSPRDFEQFSNEHRNAGDFIGAGVFMTDSPSIAQGYAIGDSSLGFWGRPGEQKTLYKIDLGKKPDVVHMETDWTAYGKKSHYAVDVKVPAGSKMYNMHQPLEGEVKDLIKQKLEDMQGGPGGQGYGYGAQTQTYELLTRDVMDYLIGQHYLSPGSFQDAVHAVSEAVKLDTRIHKDGQGELLFRNNPMDVLRPVIEKSLNEQGFAPEYIQQKLDFLQQELTRYESQLAGMPFITAGAMIDKNATLFDLSNSIWEHDFGDEFGLAASDMNEVVRDSLIELGYDGVVHIGGLLTSDGLHTHGVTVMFDANKVKIGEKVNMKDFVPPTQARYKLITDQMNNVRMKMKQHAREIEQIDARAEQLRTVHVTDESLMNGISPEDQQSLRELVDAVRADFPQYDVTRGEQYWNPSDGLIPSLHLERSQLQHLLFDYGPVSHFGALLHGLFDPISSRRIARDARQAVYNLAIPLGANAKKVDDVLGDLAARVHEQTAGPLRVPWFRDIRSLPANQVNAVAKNLFDEATWARITQRYGENGFHRLLDEAGNELVRNVDKNARRGGKGGLDRALREGYRMWTYAPIVGPVSRFASKQFYHIFRFMLDIRWHTLNLLESDILSIVREGTWRFSGEESPVGRNALMHHTTVEDVPRSMLTGSTDNVFGGPAHAMELFDSGMYLHNRNMVPILTKNFDQARLRSVDEVLNSLPNDHPVIQQLTQRFGLDQKEWSRHLDETMYSFDTRGVKETVTDAAEQVSKELGWTPEELDQMAPVIERISTLNQRSYDDLIALYSGNLHRSRFERLLNSYWLYWPISYQIKAAKWMYSGLLDRWGGRQSNMTPAYLFNRATTKFQEQMATNPEYAKQFEDNQDLWFVANMLFPATPLDLGVSLNKGVRYTASMVAPDVISPYIGVDGPEDIAVRMLEMGPVYSARLWQTIMNNTNANNAKGPYAGYPSAGGTRARSAQTNPYGL